MTTEACHREVAKPVKLDPAPPPTAAAELGTRVTADDQTARGAQQAAVRVLADLLAADLPVAIWSISDMSGGLSGHIFSRTADPDTRTAQVRAWAAALGGTTRWDPYISEPGGAWQASGSVGGIPVEVEGGRDA